MLEQHVLVAGDFESVAIALQTLRAVTIHETSERHVLAALPSGAAILARPAAAGVDIAVADATGAGIVELTARLRDILDFDISVEDVQGESAA
jgi:hypothetical protein